MITKTIFQPQVCANPSDTWLAEVRNNGWLIDHQRKDTEQDAKDWLDNHTDTDIQPHLLPVYVSMIKKYSQ